MKKKLLSFLMAICLILPCGLALTACKDPEPEPSARVVNVSLNPEIEFVLDKNEKVATVNALNEDGYAILSADVNFENMSVEDAVDKFLEISKQKGFVVSGEITPEKLAISISGENATELYNKLTASASEYLQSVGINNISFEKLEINKQALMQTVQECYKEYSTTQLNNMTEEQLVALIEQSRNETKQFVNEEVKELYYNLRLDEIRNAKFKKLQEVINALPSSIDLPTEIQDFINKIPTFVGDLETYKTNLENTLINNTEYNNALNDYITAKQNLINAKLEAEVDSTKESLIAGYEQALTTAENTYNSLKNAIPTALNEIDKINTNLIDLAYNAAMTTLQLLQIDVSAVNTAIENAGSNFIKEFTQSTGEYYSYNVSNWN